VNGKKMRLQRGDVLLTPTWQWHDHGNDGEGPVIWLDGLDLPQFRHIPVHFLEHYPEKRYPEGPGHGDLVWPWEPVKRALDGGPPECHIHHQEYVHLDGDSLSNVLGAAAELVTGETPERQETASIVYHVIEGEGKALIDGKSFSIYRGDTFCVPTWKRYSFDSPNRLYLFRFDDKPMLVRLGYYVCNPHD
jgi:gentisate 1,2-dioxygenase